MSKSSRRLKKQNAKQRYIIARENAQLLDIIPTTPEGAVRPECQISMGAAQLPELVRQALRENWSTPDAAKPAIIANLLEPFYNRDIGPDGKPIPPSRKEINELAKTLIMLDKVQHERDHPELAAAKGGPSVNISLQNTLQATAAMRQSLETVVDPAAEAERAMVMTEAAFARN